MIYTVCGIKGGVGKTTIAHSAAVFLGENGADVLLIDADTQESSKGLTELRAEAGLPERYTLTQLRGRSILSEAPKLAAKYDAVVIDCGGTDSDSLRASLVIADVAIFPFVPRTIDLLTFEKVEELLAHANAIRTEPIKAYSLLSKAPPRGPWSDASAIILAESENISYINTIITDRVAYGYAQAEGRGISEAAPPDPKALAEFTAFMEAVFSIKKKS